MPLRLSVSLVVAVKTEDLKAPEVALVVLVLSQALDRGHEDVVVAQEVLQNRPG